MYAWRRVHVFWYTLVYRDSGWWIYAFWRGIQNSIYLALGQVNLAVSVVLGCLKLAAASWVRLLDAAAPAEAFEPGPHIERLS